MLLFMEDCYAPAFCDELKGEVIPIPFLEDEDEFRETYLEANQGHCGISVFNLSAEIAMRHRYVEFLHPNIVQVYIHFTLRQTVDEDEQWLHFHPMLGETLKRYARRVWLDLNERIETMLRIMKEQEGGGRTTISERLRSINRKYHQGLIEASE
jgi:hypothetical protein